ncbi:MAG: hypothetical protein QOF73_1022 [Thermomicrobiales bacterium]|nr:hypothetical protein [Thermomicrobiales bacterium]
MVLESRSTIYLVLAQSLCKAAAHALALGSSDSPRLFRSPVIVATASDRTQAETRLGRQLVTLLSEHGLDPRLAVPPPLTVTVWRRLTRRRGGHVAIDLDPDAEQSSPVRIPSEIANAGTLIVAADLRGEMAIHPTIAIGLWTQFAGLRERLDVRISVPEEGRAAEIALAVRPTLNVLADVWRGHSVVVATSDQIAAELVGLGLKQVMQEGDDDQLGPWQDPLVQRATELDLGVRLPDQIAIRAVSLEDADPAVARHFPDFVDEIAARLGVRDVSTSKTGTTSATPSN